MTEPRTFNKGDPIPEEWLAPGGTGKFDCKVEAMRDKWGSVYIDIIEQNDGDGVLRIDYPNGWEGGSPIAPIGSWRVTNRQNGAEGIALNLERS